MAKVNANLLFEMDAMGDAIAELSAVFQSLATCHGRVYRDLERRIEALVEGENGIGEPEFHKLGGGRFVVTPGGELKEILRDARALGVA